MSFDHANTNDYCFYEDVKLSELGVSNLPYHLRHLICWRIKLHLSQDVYLHPGCVQYVFTNFINDVVENNNYSYCLKQNESILNLSFLSDGFININPIGKRLCVQLLNVMNYTVKICRGTPIAYLVIQPLQF